MLSVVVLGGGLSFVIWCLCDLLVVFYAPDNARGFDWIMLVLPIPPFIIGFFLRHACIDSPISRVIIAAFFAFIFALLLIFFIGVNFHLMIGGSL